MRGDYKTIKILLILAIAMASLSGCPNDMMRELVEQKLANPTADSFVINDGSPTSVLEVMLNSRVTKEKDRLEMRFKNEGGQWSDWMPYSDRASWVLSIGDGTKKVYAEYRDEGHNAVSMESTIVLNTGAPEGEFYVWGSAISGNRHLYVNSTSVMLCMTISNVETMRFSNDGGSTWSDWTAYSDTREWNMGSGDGPKTINAEFKTNAGTTTPSTREITVDTAPPGVAGFAINGGNSTTNNINTELGYTYTEANTTWAQYLNDGGSWSADEALDLSGSVSGKGWTLRNVNGTRTVSVRLKDIAGNVSPVYSDSIYLNTEAPDYPVPVIDPFSYTSTPRWEWEPVADADKYRVQLDGTDPYKWQEIGNIFEWTSYPVEDGIHTLYVQAADVANNWSATGSAATEVDTEFNLNIGVTPVTGGTATANMVVNVGESEPIAATPAEGYDFINWQVVSGSGVSFGNASNASTTVTLTAGNATVQAIFALKGYTLSVQAGTGGTVSSGETAQHGVPYNISATPNAGYSFDEWSISSGTGVTISSPSSASTSVTLTAGNAEVLASFTANTYAVILDRQGGTGGSASVDAVYASAMPTATAPARTGYTFGGYYTGTGGTGTQYYTAAMASARNWDIASNTTLYARWTANTYTVTLDRQSGTGGSVSVNAVYGSAMPAATAPSRTGYTFGGYYTGTGGTGTQYYTAAMGSARNWDIASNTTLYARWTVNQYTVTYNSNGATGGTVPASANYNYGSTVTVSANTGNLVRGGFSFGGWNTMPDGSGTSYAAGTGTFTMPANNVTLYARWNYLTYALRDTGPAGGLIFYDNPNWQTDGWRYLEAAPASTEWTGVQWGKAGTAMGETDTIIGIGLENTTKVVAFLNEAPAETGRAAQLCDSLSSGGYNDWFLPSREELYRIAQQLYAFNVGGFTSTTSPGTPYWSSSEATTATLYSYVVLFIVTAGGGPDYDTDDYPKEYTNRVRAVRRF